MTVAAASNAVHRGRRGFTLIEVLATMLLMAIVLPAVMQGIALSTKAASVARRRTEAAGLAESKMNEIVVNHLWLQGVNAGDFGTDWPDYKWQLTQQAWAPDTSTASLQELDLTVTWTTNGREESVKTTTLAYVKPQITSSS